MVPGVASTLGIEIDSVKCAKARAFVKQTAAALKLRLGASKLLELPSVQCCPVEKVGTQEPSVQCCPVEKVGTQGGCGLSQSPGRHRVGGTALALTHHRRRAWHADGEVSMPACACRQSWVGWGQAAAAQSNAVVPGGEAAPSVWEHGM